MGKSSRQPSELKIGDHIYTDRITILDNALYYHHGIYVGDNMVIHFKPTESKMSFASVSSSTPPKCACQSECSTQGIFKTCLDCFLDGNSLFIFEYGVSFWEADAVVLYSKRCSKPPEEVVKTATDFLKGRRQFGKYKLSTNNCEHFASYCKTGHAKSHQIEAAAVGVGGAIIISTICGAVAYFIIKSREKEKDPDNDIEE